MAGTGGGPLQSALNVIEANEKDVL